MAHATVRASSDDGGRITVALTNESGQERVVSDASAIVVEIDRRPVIRWHDPSITDDGTTTSVEGLLDGNAAARAMDRAPACRRTGLGVRARAAQRRRGAPHDHPDGPALDRPRRPRSHREQRRRRRFGRLDQPQLPLGVGRRIPAAGQPHRPRPRARVALRPLVARHGPVARARAAPATASGRALAIAPAWSGNWHIHALSGGDDHRRASRPGSSPSTSRPASR